MSRNNGMTAMLTLLAADHGIWAKKPQIGLSMYSIPTVNEVIARATATKRPSANATKRPTTMTVTMKITAQLPPANSVAGATPTPATKRNPPAIKTTSPWTVNIV